MTGFAGSVPSVSFVPSTVAPLTILSVPSVSVVCAVRLAPSVNVPAPVFSSAPAVGAAMVAETSETTETDGTVSVPPPAEIVALSLNTISLTAAFTASVAVAPSVAKMALLPSDHVASAPPFVQAFSSPQFVSVFFHVKSSATTVTTRCPLTIDFSNGTTTPVFLFTVSTTMSFASAASKRTYCVPAGTFSEKLRKILAVAAMFVADATNASHPVASASR